MHICCVYYFSFYFKYTWVYSVYTLQGKRLYFPFSSKNWTVLFHKYWIKIHSSSRRAKKHVENYCLSPRNLLQVTFYFRVDAQHAWIVKNLTKPKDAAMPKKKSALSVNFYRPSKVIQLLNLFWIMHPITKLGALCKRDGEPIKNPVN